MRCGILVRSPAVYLPSPGRRGRHPEKSRWCSTAPPRTDGRNRC